MSRARRILGLMLRPAAVVGIVAVAAAAAVNTAFALQRTVDAAPKRKVVSDVILGAYTGPTAEGIRRLGDWERWSGVKSPYALEFAAADSWPNIVGPDWLLSPWRTAGKRLIYSLPLLTVQEGEPADAAAAGLSSCAKGEYDGNWTQLGRNLVSNNLPTTIVRPGWEFNGSWYSWAAAGHEGDYKTCFQQVVKAMRTVPGQQFEFLWNPAVGQQELAAEEAYPGNEFVDYIGVDVYDESWLPGTYPYSSGDAVQRQNAAKVVWDDLVGGGHGLRYWSSFAQEKGRKFAIPEWGLSKRADGHGGEDNVLFVENMLAYINDPANGVDFAMYFDFDSAGHGEHLVSAATSVFPMARRSMFERLHQTFR